jgi:spermidine/putrescine transport system substrate-binding protein
MFSVSSCQTHCDRSVPAHSSNHQKIHLFIWGEYTSKRVFSDFYTKTGIEVVETNFATNEEMLAKIQTGAAGYDLIVPSDYMVTVMSKMGLLTPIDKTRIPNIKNVEKDLLNQPYDSQNIYSIPYSWSVVGITYNAHKITPPVESYGDLFTRRDLLYRFSVLDDSREMMASVLKMLGFSANTTNHQHLERLEKKLLQVKKRCREFNSAPTSQLLHGDLLAAQMYSNEALKLSKKSSKFRFRIPNDGFTMAIDNFVIPKNSKRQDLSYQLINYLLQPQVNLQFATDVLTAPVIKGVHDQLPSNLQAEAALGPLGELTKKAEMIFDLKDYTKKYDKLWTELKVKNN